MMHNYSLHFDVKNFFVNVMRSSKKFTKGLRMFGTLFGTIQEIIARP